MHFLLGLSNVNNLDFLFLFNIDIIIGNKAWIGDNHKIVWSWDQFNNLMRFLAKIILNFSSEHAPNIDSPVFMPCYDKFLDFFVVLAQMFEGAIYHEIAASSNFR